MFVCSPNNPTGTVEAREVIERLAEVAAAARRAARRRRGVRRVRAVERGGARRRRPPARRRAHVLEGVVARRGAARVRGRARVGDRRAREGAAAVHALGADAGRGHVALEFRAEMDTRVATLVEERGRLFAALQRAAGRCTRIRRAPTSCSSASTAMRTTSGSDCSSAACSCATSRRWPRVEGCLRVTVGTPAENDAFLAALQEVYA